VWKLFCSQGSNIIVSFKSRFGRFGHGSRKKPGNPPVFLLRLARGRGGAGEKLKKKIENPLPD